MELGPKVAALFWLPAAILSIIIALHFLPIMLSVLPQEMQYLAYLVLGLVVFFAIYLFYRKWKGEE